jgi:hypothetical protein
MNTAKQRKFRLVETPVSMNKIILKMSVESQGNESQG